MKTIEDLTGSSKGIILHQDVGLFCEWSGLFGVPHLGAYRIFTFGDGSEVPEVEGVIVGGREVADLLRSVPSLVVTHPLNSLPHIHSDIQQILSADSVTSTIWRLHSHRCAVILPHIWRYSTVQGRN